MLKVECDSLLLTIIVLLSQVAILVAGKIPILPNDFPPNDHQYFVLH